MKRENTTTTDGGDLDTDEGAPLPINPATGMHGSYFILTAEERAKGFVRPVREAYRHVGPPGPKHPLRPLTDEERERYANHAYVSFEDYPESERPMLGRAWTQAQLDAVGKGCGSETRMARSIAETYARQPDYYGSTFCVQCRTHLPVGAGGEFIWVDGNGERVGT